MIIVLLFVQILFLNLFGGLSNDHVEIDGKYCLYNNSETCHHPIVKIHTKYPFLVVRIHEGKEEEGRRKIHVVKPLFWHDIPSLNMTAGTSPIIEFTFQNVTGGILKKKLTIAKFRMTRLYTGMIDTDSTTRLLGLGSQFLFEQ